MCQSPLMGVLHNYDRRPWWHYQFRGVWSVRQVILLTVTWNSPPPQIRKCPFCFEFIKSSTFPLILKENEKWTYFFTLTSKSSPPGSAQLSKNNKRGAELSHRGRLGEKWKELDWLLLKCSPTWHKICPQGPGTGGLTSSFTFTICFR